MKDAIIDFAGLLLSPSSIVLAFVKSFDLNILTPERTVILIIVSYHVYTIQNGLLQSILSGVSLAFIFLIHLSFTHCHDLLKFFFLFNSLQLISMNFFVQDLMLILPSLLENMLLKIV